MSTTLRFEAEAVRQAIRAGTGANIQIAVVDTGIDRAHPDLRDLTLVHDVAVVERKGELQIEGTEAADDHGHGTAIAGILHSLAPEARLGNFKAIGVDLVSRTRRIHAACLAAIQTGYQILNCSFGCGQGGHLPWYKEIVDAAYLKGVHVVAACSNLNVDHPEWPGYFPSVLAVNFARESDPLKLYVRRGQMVEFAARGVGVRVPWLNGTTHTMTGSSFAVPHVTAMLARLLSQNPELSPLEAKAALLAAATEWSWAIAGSNALRGLDPARHESRRI